MSADLYQLAFQVALMPESVSHNQSYCSEVLLVKLHNRLLFIKKLLL